MKKAFAALNPRARDVSLRLEHRLGLVQFWLVKEGDKILEVGCGQGDTTVVLAATVGTQGAVTAVDSAPPTYGGPMTLGKSHEFVNSLSLGAGIRFLTSTNLLDSGFEFQEQTFDLVVFAHSSWYMACPEELRILFSRARPWAKRLGYAEWDIRPQHLSQLPHFLAGILQAQVQAIYRERVGKYIECGNIRTLIHPDQARMFAQEASWKILKESVVATSTRLKPTEIGRAIRIADECSSGIPKASADLIYSERHLLNTISSHDDMSLHTYAFLAE